MVGFRCRRRSRPFERSLNFRPQKQYFWHNFPSCFRNWKALKHHLLSEAEKKYHRGVLIIKNVRNKLKCFENASCFWRNHVVILFRRIAILTIWMSKKNQSFIVILRFINTLWNVPFLFRTVRTWNRSHIHFK